MSNILGITEQVDSILRAMKIVRDPKVNLDVRIDYCKQVLNHVTAQYPESYMVPLYASRLEDLQLELITKEVLDVLGKD